MLVTITPKRLKRIHRSKMELDRSGFNEDGNLVFRVVIIKLVTGEKEILLTSLINKEEHPYIDFKELYFKRWKVEESYKFIKAIEIENFSGKSTLAVEQDFHATVLVTNSHALLMLESEDEMKKQNKEKNSLRAAKKYEYCINKKVSLEAMKNEFVCMLLDRQSAIDVFCEKIKEIMKYDLIPKRPGRSYKRVRRNSRRKYHMNQR